MKIKKAASVPLVLHDPFFSVWSSADRLNDKDTTHWSGVRQKRPGGIYMPIFKHHLANAKENHCE